MPATYIYRCRQCAHEWESLTRGESTCPSCWQTDVGRVFSFSLQRIMHQHWDHSVGAPVSDVRDLADKLKRASEAQTARTGIEHNFVPVDASDPASVGVTDEGMDATRRRLRAEGRTSGQSYFPSAKPSTAPSPKPPQPAPAPARPPSPAPAS